MEAKLAACLGVIMADLGANITNKGADKPWENPFTTVYFAPGWRVVGAGVPPVGAARGDEIGACAVGVDDGAAVETLSAVVVARYHLAAATVVHAHDLGVGGSMRRGAPPHTRGRPD